MARHPPPADPCRPPPHRHAVPERQRRIGAEALSTRCWQATHFNGLVVAYPSWGAAELDAAVRGIAEVLQAMPRR